MHLKMGKRRQPFCNNKNMFTSTWKTAKDADVTPGVRVHILNRCSVSYIGPEDMQSRKPKRRMLYKVQWLGNESLKHEYQRKRINSA